MPRKEGQFLVEDYFLNQGGLNTSDSPFVVEASQATGGQNFDYLKRGGVQKRAGHSVLNSTPDAQLKTWGLGIWDKPGSSRAVIRAAGTKIQNFNYDTALTTSLSEDTLASTTDFLALSTLTPVVHSMFNTPTSGVLWMAGGGMGGIYGVYSDSKTTLNGVESLSGTTSVSETTGAGVWAATGNYRYAFTLYKASTGVIGNCLVAQDCIVTISDVAKVASIDLSRLDPIDTTKYTKLFIYRSAVGGSAAFSTGDLAQELDISGGVPATAIDTGTYVSTSENVPRVDSLFLDNSALATGTYSTLTTFKRRLVTAKGSTIFLSDLNKSESWPSLNNIQIPSGGDITALAVISFNTPTNSNPDELLCIFKQRELWILTGSALEDWSLKFIDTSGCPSQSLIVPASGYVSWVGYRGVYIWDGAGKPAYASQSIEDKFQPSGDLDKSKLSQGWGVFIHSRNEIQWYLSSGSEGTQKYVLKLDLKLTLTNSSASFADRVLKGIFTPDVTGMSLYAGVAYLPSISAPDERVILADDAGYLYLGFVATSENGASYDMEYESPFVTLGSVNSAKRVHKVVAWVLDTGNLTLELDFWSNYRYSDTDKSTQEQTLVSSLTSSLIWGALSAPAVCTISIGSPGVITQTAHGYGAGDTVTFTTTGALPTGLAVGTDYLVHSVPTVDTFKVTATLGGSAINTSGGQSGVQSVQVAIGGSAWDVGIWDLTSKQSKPLVYNLFSAKNNTEGDAFKFRFRHSGDSNTVVLYGYSVFYTELGLRK